jgi:hypothetical protein
VRDHEALGQRAFHLVVLGLGGQPREALVLLGLERRKLGVGSDKVGIFTLPDCWSQNCSCKIAATRQCDPTRLINHGARRPLRRGWIKAVNKSGLVRHHLTVDLRTVFPTRRPAVEDQALG